MNPIVSYKNHYYHIQLFDQILHYHVQDILEDGKIFWYVIGKKNDNSTTILSDRCSSKEDAIKWLNQLMKTEIFPLYDQEIYKYPDGIGYLKLVDKYRKGVGVGVGVVVGDKGEGDV